MKDVMVDIETLGTRSTSLITQIGACYFDRDTGEIGETFSECTYSNDDVFTVDYDSIRWWLTQSEDARMSLLDCPIPLQTSITHFNTFLHQGAKFVWSHATFDIPILLHAFNHFGIKFPLHYTKMRDVRTLMDVTGHKTTTERGGIHHNALDDCIFQVQYCTEALKKI